MLFIKSYPFTFGKYLTLFCLIVSLEATARAEQSYHSLSMHGEAKYRPDAPYLDYANPDAPKGGTIVMNAIGTFDTLNPYSIKGKAAQGLNLVYDRLMQRVWDEPFTLYPLIAERVEVPEDRSAITFHLNPKARFHDGSAVTADDVLFSFETLKTEGRPNMRQIYRLVETAAQTGERSVTFTLGDHYDRETVMILAMMPVLSQDWWQGRVFDSTTLEPPLLNGPYRIAAVDPGRRIVYERVPDYWATDLQVNRGHYNFERVIHDYYRDDTVAFEAFKAGSIDLRREYDAGRWASAYDFPAATKGSVVQDAISHGRPERVNALIFNMRRAPFDDLKVRQALNLLLDFNWINTYLFSGQYQRIESVYPNSDLAAQDGPPHGRESELLEPYRESLPEAVFEDRWHAPVFEKAQDVRTNMLAAKTLLEEAGWRVEGGSLVKDGKPFVFEILAGSPEHEKIALHFARSLEKMGITARIRVADSAAFQDRLNAYDYDMVLYHWLSTLSPGTEQPLYWGCTAAEQQARWNFTGLCHPAVEALAGAIAQSSTRQELLAYTRALDRILMHLNIMVPLHYLGKDLLSYKAAIRRPETVPLYGAVLETWWMNPDAPRSRD